jgi:hypothetical protein
MIKMNQRMIRKHNRKLEKTLKDNDRDGLCENCEIVAFNRSQARLLTV